MAFYYSWKSHKILEYKQIHKKERVHEWDLKPNTRRIWWSEHIGFMFWLQTCWDLGLCCDSTLKIPTDNWPTCQKSCKEFGLSSILADNEREGLLNVVANQCGAKCANNGLRAPTPPFDHHYIVWPAARICRPFNRLIKR